MAFERDSEHELVWYIRSLLAFQDVSMYVSNESYQPCVTGSLVAALFYCANKLHLIPIIAVNTYD